MRAWIIVVFAGCWSSTAPSAEKTAPPPTCDVLLAQFKETSIVIALEGDRDPELREILEARADAWMPSRAECDAWTPAFKRCLYAIETEADNFACSRAQQIEQGVDMGGPACTTVADHMLTFLPHSSDPELASSARTRLLDGCVAMPRKMKECTLRANGFEAYIACADPKDRARIGKVYSGSQR